MEIEINPALSEHLQEIVDDGDLLRLFLGPQQRSIHRVVDFSKEPPKHDMQNNVYKILLRNSFVETGSQVVCLFPNHNNKSKRILESKRYKSRDEFNKELNARFSESPEQTEQFKDHRLLVLYGTHCFICSKITGTIYIVWAEKVSKINASNTFTIPHTDVPLIFNLNGLNKIKSMYLLRSQIDNKPTDLSLFPLTKENPMLMYDIHYNPFVCEERPERFSKKNIHVVSSQEARAMVMQTTQDAVDWLPFERLPFAQVEDTGLVEIDHGAHLPWAESPREVFLDASPRVGGGGGLLIRDTVGPAVFENNNNNTRNREPDPFENTLDDELSSFSKGVEIELEDL